MKNETYHPCTQLYFGDWKKDSSIKVLLDDRLKAIFKQACIDEGLTMEEVIRAFVNRWALKKYRQKHNITVQDLKEYRSKRHKQKYH